jgi:hypothetical protein
MFVKIIAVAAAINISYLLKMLNLLQMWHCDCCMSAQIVVTAPMNTTDP